MPLRFGADGFADIALGQIPAGGRRELVLRLRNETDTNVKLARLEISCDCLSLQDFESPVSPGEALPVRLVCDMKYEPDFLGTLAMEVVGYDVDGAVVLRLRADAKVVGKAGQHSAAAVTPPEPMPMHGAAHANDASLNSEADSK